MANSSILQQPHGTEERHGVTGPSTRASLEARRAAVLSYQQLVAGPVLSPTVARPPLSNQGMADAPRISAENLARDPLAHPMAPVRPERAAKRVYEVVREPVGGPPVTEPRYRGPVHGVAFHGVRSRLSPLQRAALRRTESRHELERKPDFVTYTVNPREAK